MPMVRGMRVLNAIEAGTLNATDLQTLLTADAGRLAELNTLFSLRGQMRRAMQSVTPQTAIFGSAAALDAMVTNFDAMQTVAASQTAMTAIIASSVAMTAIAASSVALAAVFASSVALAAVVNSSVAMDAIAASSVAIAAVVASSVALTAVVNSSVAMTAVAASSVAMTAVAASSVAMDAVVNSSVAMTAIADSQIGRLALFNSDTALDAIFNNSSARNILRASSSYGIVTTASVVMTTSRAIPVPDTAGSYIVLGFSASGSGVTTITASTLRSGTTRPNEFVGTLPANTATGNAATPLVEPFSAFGDGGTASRSFQFGLLRCDV